MRAFQKLEICASLIAIFIALRFFYTETFFELNNTLDGEPPAIKIIIEGFMFYIFPALLLVIGSYLHIKKDSKVGFFLLTVGGIFSIIFSCITLMATLVAHHRYGWTNSLIAILLGLTSAFAIYCALRLRKLSSLLV